ncbi:MAG TPA: hypothetical protein VFB84_07450 [Micromonosporaceae bacterium]|nr:hypothetical protein [Micromonosporaceae bacterium]
MGEPDTGVLDTGVPETGMPDTGCVGSGAGETGRSWDEPYTVPLRGRGGDDGGPG